MNRSDNDIVNTSIDNRKIILRTMEKIKVPIKRTIKKTIVC